jgi:intracellular multiplication protein IcmG
MHEVDRQQQTNPTAYNTNDYNQPEYQLQDDSYEREQSELDIPSENPPTATTPESKSILARFDHARIKKFLIPVGLVVAIFILYNILGWYSHYKQKEEIKPFQVQQVQQARGITPATPLTPSTPSLVATQQANAALYQQLGTISQTTEQNREQINHLTDGLNTNQNILIELGKSVAALSASVDSLSRDVQTLVEASKKPVKVVKKAPPKIAYHIKAIVPGRAWLEAANGQTITVRTGDVINGGTVQMISPRQGLVTLSTGEVIQYGSNDI